jgi:hypothetical protein
LSYTGGKITITNKCTARIADKATGVSVTSRAAGIEIRDIERLENREEESAELLSKGTPIAYDFWESPSLDDLAEAQNVQPIANVESLYGTWPGEADDGFEDIVLELRHSFVHADTRGIPTTAVSPKLRTKRRIK